MGIWNIFLTFIQITYFFDICHHLRHRKRERRDTHGVRGSLVSAPRSLIESRDPTTSSLVQPTTSHFVENSPTPTRTLLGRAHGPQTQTSTHTSTVDEGSRSFVDFLPPETQRTLLSYPSVVDTFDVNRGDPSTTPFPHTERNPPFTYGIFHRSELNKFLATVGTIPRHSCIVLQHQTSFSVDAFHSLCKT